MIEPKAVQYAAPLSMFCYGNNWTLVIIAKIQGPLDCPHYSQAFQVWFQFGLKIGKELADIVFPGNTNNAGNLTIKFSHECSNGMPIVFAPEIPNVRGPGETYRYLRFMFSTDSISAIAARRVAGNGAFASRHILESVSQSPPKAKLSS